MYSLLFSPVRDSYALSVLTLHCLSLQEARAEWDHQGQASITGSPSPPPGTRLQIQAKQDALLGRLTLKRWLKGRVSQKEKGRKITRLATMCFYSFYLFRTFHFITVVLFSVLFLLEHCECYFRWHFVLLLLTLHLIDWVENKPVWVRVGVGFSCSVVQGVIIISIALNSAAAPTQGKGVGR